MKYKQLILVEALVEYCEKGEKPTEEIIQETRKVIEREKAILQERSQRSKKNIENAWVKYAL